MADPQFQFPGQGIPRDQLINKMKTLRANDLKWEDGRVFSLIFEAGEEANALLKEAHGLFFSENGLNPTAFPSLRQFETEVIAMSAHLLGGTADTVGNMTSGGTESILLAVKTARDYARANDLCPGTPEIIIPATGHPAFDKAGEYFDVKIIHTPVNSEYSANVSAIEAAITPNTIMLVGSAPAYPHGIVDPIEDISNLALKYKLLCHVDACVGGFILPFVHQLGYDIPKFDFTLPGVTSISADLHKYGYAAKGASVLLYRTRELRRHQLYVHTEWPGGIYASPTMLGTRAGSTIAAAWAIMNFLGAEGYRKIAQNVMHAVEYIRAGIDEIDDIFIVGNPAMSIMAIASNTLDIYEVGDEMSTRGWHLDRQHFPDSLHMTINHLHLKNISHFLEDLKISVLVVKSQSISQMTKAWSLRFLKQILRIFPKQIVSWLVNKSSVFFRKTPSMPKRSAAMYGMMGSLPNRGDLKELVLDMVEDFTRPIGN